MNLNMWIWHEINLLYKCYLFIMHIASIFIWICLGDASWLFDAKVLLDKRKYFAPAWSRTPDHVIHSLISIWIVVCCKTLSVLWKERLCLIYFPICNFFLVDFLCDHDMVQVVSHLWKPQIHLGSVMRIK